MTEVCSQCVEHAPSGDYVTVTVTINEVSYCIRSILEDSFFTESMVRIDPGDLLGAFVCFSYEATGIASGLVEEGLSLRANVFRFLERLRTLLRCRFARVLQQRLRLSKQVRGPGNRFGQFLLCVTFRVPEHFILPE